MANEDRKTYGQMCALAMALDRIGDRWTMLIMRELLGGPARFSELKEGLPGIATNLLTTRLRRLESDGLVRRSGGYNTTYSLTAVGSGIRTALYELGQWGFSLGPMCDAAPVSSPRSLAMPLQSILGNVRSATGGGEPFVVELDVDGSLIELVLGEGVTVTARPSVDADARARSTVSKISALLLAASHEDTTIEHVDGDEAATGALDDLLSKAAAMASAQG